MKTCGTCAHWIEDKYPAPGVGGCFGGPPSVLMQMRPSQKAVLAMPGPGGSPMQGMEPVLQSVRPPVQGGERACGAYTPRPENGETAGG
ncbi:MAG: hypothetical protein ACYTFQ_32650 [Planctomycetota bacterium]|jgi:hypothetical protein